MNYGLLLIDKPQGITSFDVVRKIKKLCNTSRVGHTGTLDPMASGLLPVLVGKATVLSDYLICADKRYVAKVKLGIATDTYDVTGKIISEKNVNVTEDELKNAVTSFLGKSMQTPPVFSAIKQNGVRMYELARKGEKTEIPPREINISEISVYGFNSNEFYMDVTCSKGTYIRTLCNDIGNIRGCGAVLIELKRVATGGFSLSDAVPLYDLTEENIGSYIKNADTAVGYMRSVNVSEKQASRFSSGGVLSVSHLHLKDIAENEKIRVYYSGTFLGIGSLKTDGLKIECSVERYEMPKEKRPFAALCLGTFDGLHAGHRAVLNTALNGNFSPAVLCFPYPPVDSYNALISKSDKEAELYKLGFKKVSFLNFDTVRNMTADEFENYLLSRYNLKRICCGYDYSYGLGRTGNTETLRAFAEKNGIELIVTPPVCENGQPVSSTYIRKLIEEGKIEEANSLLFEPFSFVAEISHGDERGRQMGFPTINQIYPEHLVEPRYGVYKVKAEIDGKFYTGLANIGHRPTYRVYNCICETYLFDFSDDVYGKKARIILEKFLRPERKFSGLEELKKQIEEDCNTVKQSAEE